MKQFHLLIFLFFSVKVMCQDIAPCKVCSSNEVYIVDSPLSKLKSLESRIYRIPVVFHVFDPSNPESKLSVEKAQKAIDLLNANFNGQSRNIDDVQNEFRDVVADVGFEFVLARKDPYGNSINGITYHKRNCKGDNSGANLTMKKQVNWNTGRNIGGIQRYLQVWLTYNVNGDDYGSGWCYLPSYDEGGRWAGPTYNYKFMGDGSSSNDDILTHEIGHYFGLSHTFGPSYNSCGDDGIDDTPITRCYTWECKIGDLCQDGNVNTENYMDYSGCTSMFTLGQKELMLYWVNQPARKSLWSDDNLKFTGVINDPDVATGIVEVEKPTISIYPNPSEGNFNIEGVDSALIKMYDLNGRLVYQTTDMNFSYNKSGVYIVVIESGNTQTKIKVVVNKFIR